MPFDGSPARTAGLLMAVDRTIELLRDEARWGRREETSADGRYCLIGALKAAGGGERLVAVVLSAARRITRFPYPRLDLFNDDPVTSHRHIMAVLQEARQEIASSP
jgi:hypothetical protein